MVNYEKGLNAHVRKRFSTRYQVNTIFIDVKGVFSPSNIQFSVNGIKSANHKVFDDIGCIGLLKVGKPLLILIVRHSDSVEKF